MGMACPPCQSGATGDGRGGGGTWRPPNPTPVRGQRVHRKQTQSLVKPISSWTLLPVLKTMKDKSFWKELHQGSQEHPLLSVSLV